MAAFLPGIRINFLMLGYGSFFNEKIRNPRDRRKLSVFLMVTFDVPYSFIVAVDTVY
jgi:hypothetical protein